jgi:PIN domain nuclease of toxin-antitoxin system
VASLIYLDTHVAVWLAAPRLDLLSAPARAAIESDDDLRVSPMVALELEYLREIERVSAGSDAILQSLAAQLGVRICDLPFPRIARAAVEQRWTRDPFDRVIVGHASTAQRQLVTRDETIQANYERALW